MEGNFSPNLPIYLQLTDSVKRKIVSGQLSPGDRIASVRDLAQEFGVNPNTVQRALSELERTGLIYSERTSGRFITDHKELIEMARKELAQECISRFVQEVAALGLSKDELIKEIERRLEEGNNDASDNKLS